jgi:DNA-binding CsgD family transcriptional regulator
MASGYDASDELPNRGVHCATRARPFTPWAAQGGGDQARRELHASGESSVRRNPTAVEQLTAQELQIAQLAALGLSNREIGERLYLSPRTDRRELASVLSSRGSEEHAKKRRTAGS